MALVITSRQHPIVKEFRELAHGADPSMLLDGWHLLDRGASAAGIAIETVAWCGPPTAAEQITLERAQRARRARDRSVGQRAERALAVNTPTGVVASRDEAARRRASACCNPHPP